MLGAAALGWTIGGRAAIALLPGSGTAGSLGGSVLVVLAAVYAFLPWLFVAVLLGLLACQNRVGTLPAKLLVGAVLGPLACAGLPAAAVIAGLVLGPLAGLVLRWRELAGEP